MSQINNLTIPSIVVSIDGAFTRIDKKHAFAKIWQAAYPKDKYVDYFVLHNDDAEPVETDININ